MTDFLKKRGGFPAGVPIIGEKSAEGFAPKDDAFLRDVTAANFGVNIRNEADMAALLSEEKYFCDLCGAEYPMWPIRHWAAHYVHDHHAEITIQQSGGVAQLCTSKMTPSIQEWFGMQLLARVGIRRRARDLGLISWLPPRPSGGEN